MKKTFNNFKFQKINNSKKIYFVIFLITTLFYIIFDNLIYIKPTIYHKYFHHTLPANSEISKQWGYEKHTICTDDNGFKINCGNLSYDFYDIAFIGDSFIQGIGNYDDTLVGYVANDFPNLKILNLGVSSYSPSVYLKKVEYYLKKNINFSHLFVYIDISDIQDEANYYEKDGKIKSQYILSKNNNLIKRDKIRIIKDFIKNLIPFTYDKIATIRRINKKMEFSANPYLKNDNRASWTYNENISFAKKWSRDEAIDKALYKMKELHTILSRNNIKLSLGVYPWPHQLLYDKSDSLQVEIWRDFCENRCSSFINSFDTFFELKNIFGIDYVFKNYYIKNDVHFNKHGDYILFENFKEQSGIQNSLN